MMKNQGRRREGQMVNKGQVIMDKEVMVRALLFILKVIRGY